MIVVKVELHSAVTGQVTELGRAIIANTGGSSTRGDYRAAIARKGQENLALIWAKPQRESQVRNYPRLSLNVWHLISRALNAAGYK